jgi:hypothetical protein
LGGVQVLTQRAGDTVTGVRALGLSMPIAALALTCSAGPSTFGRLTWSLLAIGLGLALLMPVLPFSLELLALRRLTAPAFGTLMSLEPAVALTIGLVVLGQVPGPSGAGGVVVVVAAGIGAERTGARSDRPRKQPDLLSLGRLRWRALTREFLARGRHCRSTADVRQSPREPGYLNPDGYRRLCRRDRRPRPSASPRGRSPPTAMTLEAEATIECGPPVAIASRRRLGQQASRLSLSWPSGHRVGRRAGFPKRRGAALAAASLGAAGRLVFVQSATRWFHFCFAPSGQKCYEGVQFRERPDRVDAAAVGAENRSMRRDPDYRYSVVRDIWSPWHAEIALVRRRSLHGILARLRHHGRDDAVLFHRTFTHPDLERLRDTRPNSNASLTTQTRESSAASSTSE